MDCIIPDPHHSETKDQLLAKFALLTADPAGAPAPAKKREAIECDPDFGAALVGAEEELA